MHTIFGLRTVQIMRLNKKLMKLCRSLFELIYNNLFDDIHVSPGPPWASQKVELARMQSCLDFAEQSVAHSKSIRPVSSYATLRQWRTNPHSLGAHCAALQMYHRFFQLRVYWSNGFTVAWQQQQQQRHTSDGATTVAVLTTTYWP